MQHSYSKYYLQSSLIFEIFIKIFMRIQITNGSKTETVKPKSVMWNWNINKKYL